MLRASSFVAAALLALTNVGARADAPMRHSTAKVLRIVISPASLELVGPRSCARPVVTAIYANGETRDVTDGVVVNVSPAGLVEVDKSLELRPERDGVARLLVTFGGLTTFVKVSVRSSRASAPVSFDREVEPILTRAGCNQGSCHGAQAGKGGFKLSLAGYDPDLDYQAIARAGRARRIASADPAHSLILLKPTMAVPHGGGRRIDPSSADYATLVRWIKDGVPGPIAAEPTLTRLEVLPSERILTAAQGPMRLVAIGTYSDGTTEDVTAHSRVSTLNDTVAGCTPDGVVTAGASGQTAIMVRYGPLATISTVIVPFNGPNVAELTISPLPGATAASGIIDELIAAKQRQLGLAPSPLCDDETFLRRVSVDLLGALPTEADRTAFLTDKRADRRARLIDRLLDRPQYADFWTLKWGDLLRSNRTSLGGAKGMWSFTNWIHSQFAANRPIDAMVRDLITARGSTFTDGPSNYYRVAADPESRAETTSQVFLGVRLQCARCHNHPFERWTQADYYRFAAFFARVGVKGSNEFGMFGGEQIVRINDGGEVRHPKSGEVMPPTALGVPVAKTADYDSGGDRRIALANWLTSPTNRMFARNIANRYWGYLFGTGIVNPIDDIRTTNPPTNPALLDALADDLVKAGFDLKQLIRVIANSRAYQRSAEADRYNRQDELFFTHFTPRRLQAETLLDAIDSVCGTREKFTGLPSGTLAVQLPDPAVGSDFLDAFGRPQRQIACECERTAEPNLAQTLRMMNGEMVNRKVAENDGRLAKLLTAKRSDDAILRELYLSALGRPPSRDERDRLIATLAFSVDRKPMFEDILLTLLNSKEFLFNH